MVNWQQFSKFCPDIAEAFSTQLSNSEVAFLGTVSAGQKPRIHPIVPRIVDGQLLAFIMLNSPKLKDLRDRGVFTMHTLPGEQDEESLVSGVATLANKNFRLRETAACAMGFATGVDDTHILFEFQIDFALATQWLDFGTPDHRPTRKIWRHSNT